MVKLKVNGIDRTFEGDSNMPLLWYVRDVLGLTGTKFGCGMALCGACTVHKNGEAIRSCITPVSAAAGGEIRTIENLGADGLHAVQQAWMELNVPQCGYCQSGQIMQAVSFLNSTPILRISKSMTPWQATSAAAEPTSEFARRSSWQRGKSHDANRKCKPAEIPQRRVWGGRIHSRRSVCPTDAGARTDHVRRNRSRQGDLPSQSFCRDSAGWNRLHRSAPVRNGNGHPYVPAARACRRA